MIDEKVINRIIDKYFKQDNILSLHQIESYNDYVENILPKILEQFFPFKINFNDNKIKTIELKIENMNIETPHYTENNGCTKIMTPNVARLRNFTYSLTVFIDISVSIKINSDGEDINLPIKLIKDIKRRMTIISVRL